MSQLTVIKTRQGWLPAIILSVVPAAGGKR